MLTQIFTSIFLSIFITIYYFYCYKKTFQKFEDNLNKLQEEIRCVSGGLDKVADECIKNEEAISKNEEKISEKSIKLYEIICRVNGIWEDFLSLRLKLLKKEYEKECKIDFNSKYCGSCKFLVKDFSGSNECFEKYSCKIFNIKLSQQEDVNHNLCWFRDERCQNYFKKETKRSKP